MHHQFDICPTKFVKTFVLLWVMSTLKSKFQSLYQDKFFLEQENASLETYLKKQDWLRPEDHLKTIEKPGEGNMNLVLRVTPEEASSFILKQARPWVEKYPQLAAPIERIMVEFTFYQQVHAHPTLSAFSPKVLGFDANNYLLALEDLGEAVDFSFVYQKGSFFDPHYLNVAVNYLNALKELPVPPQYPDNLALRQLNHQHIFYLPFMVDNSFDLDDIQPGLQQLSQPCKTDPELFSKIQILGRCYLETGDTLLHGDFYPGSLLQADGSLKVIDPEFSFAGPAEWDIAIFISHLLLSETPIELIRLAYSSFQKATDFDESRFSGFVGTEILRRLLGLAQLPLEMDLEQKAQLIAQSIQWIKKGNIDILLS